MPVPPPSHRDRDAVEWSVAIFAKNEEATIIACLEAVERAVRGLEAQVTVVVNGSSDGTAERLVDRMQGGERSFEAFDIAYGDKANAWNQFLYRLRRPAETYFFVDAYALVQEGGFTALAQHFARSPSARAVTAVPSCGRSAGTMLQRMRSQGGLHGSFHALSGAFVERICQRGIRMPLGMYWGDGLIAGMAMHDLDPSLDLWERAHIGIAEDVTWSMRPLSPFRWTDIRRQYNRAIQQKRGRLQFRALKRIISEQGYEALPRAVDPLVVSWVREQPAERMPRLAGDPLGWLAMRRIEAWRMPESASLEPVSLLRRQSEAEISDAEKAAERAVSIAGPERC